MYDVHTYRVLIVMDGWMDGAKKISLWLWLLWMWLWLWLWLWLWMWLDWVCRVRRRPVQVLYIFPFPSVFSNRKVFFSFFFFPKAKKKEKGRKKKKKEEKKEKMRKKEKKKKQARACATDKFDGPNIKLNPAPNQSAKTNPNQAAN
ncbi:hypothetical protein BZA05DRAFT_253290 [Tricharina praecox]|uniref:uncharacterized protein n=1 Tax=Tricharina praecox TaxID=43433 RepID=UPI00221FE37D|nr:uncharacterized protein BZA05DRAFT_253290 [Tricharina praecox]KAI5854906.1 hypothetical protein BZA05DRAFT_253290 [Tricharina praecox]